MKERRRSCKITAHHPREGLLLILLLEEEVVGIVYHYLLRGETVLAKLTSHLAGSLDSARVYIDPIILVGTKTLVSVPVGVHLLPIFAKSPERDSHSLCPVLHAHLHDGCGIPIPAESVNQ